MGDIRSKGAHTVRFSPPLGSESTSGGARVNRLARFGLTKMRAVILAIIILLFTNIIMTATPSWYHKAQPFVFTFPPRSLGLQISHAPARDFALYANGGRIACRLTSGCGGLTLWPSSSAVHAISDNQQIGNCWALPASSGQVGLILSAPISPSHVTIDHIPRAVAADIGQAPRHLILWGIVEGKHNREKVQRVQIPKLDILKGRSGPRNGGHHQYAPIAVFEYDVRKGGATQTFDVFNTIAGSEVSFRVVVLEIVDNWGAGTTCLYRVQVHGTEI